ncbi:MAG TPA: penicillin-binding protein 1B, partial [Lysobacter sp.]|nr:penicillin-binding protein 1B [Lysobacter sp.]
MDYDEDDDSDQDDSSETGQWKRRLVTWTLAAIGLGLGFLIPYMLYLNHEVSERFGRLQWQIPTRVYARPLELRPGQVLDTRTLKTELDAAGYHPGDGSREGSY